DFTAATIGYGINSTGHGTRSALFVEGARHAGLTGIYGRLEVLQVETALLQSDVVVEGPAAEIKDPVVAFTAGAVRDVLNVRGWDGGFGADVTFYRTPDALRSAYGDHPVSFHLFFRLRPPAGSMGRMWNMRMSQPMLGHTEMPMNDPMPEDEVSGHHKCADSTYAYDVRLSCSRDGGLTWCATTSPHHDGTKPYNGS